jgi:hypothetical protein
MYAPSEDEESAKTVGTKQAADKFTTGQELQGLKPVIFLIVYGPTKVVP